MPWRICVALTVFLISLAYALPSVPGISESFLGRMLPAKQISLGLDLKGGIHLTLGVEVSKAIANSLAQTGHDLRVAAQDDGVTILRPRVIAGNVLEFTLPRGDQKEKFQELAAKKFAVLVLGAPVAAEAGQLRYTARFTDEHIKQLSDMALEQALRTIRNRIDQFGVAEPDIRKQADNRIQVQLPGLSDTKRAVHLLGQTANLEFHLVRDDVDPAKPVLPAGVAIYPMLDKKADGLEKSIALDRDVLLTGADVSDARPAFDNMNQSYVVLNFNSRGAVIFERITGENTGRRLAIVLDGKVYSAPNIRERIAGGRASITGGFSTAEAQDLAIVLRAGSLPAPVSVLEERTVGPSLGQESIDSGIKAAMLGGVLVVVFMAVYYAVSGLIADVMLVYTMTMLMAGLAAFGATLTLPGIAGIVLTIGMAVDANVLIYERIREELLHGLTPPAAVKAGFERASIAITDSNLTTIIATAILYQFGTGPIRGFAVTLSLGVAASMFTAVFVSRIIFELWARRAGPRGLSI
ncbi:MAG: protein translocase subunit SecD [Deltaproteobacteria bacterium]|jgi:preprotein translocase subunit SecD|nr:protein translocase subunit SecD [Deltaproteobacteria bacterium]